MAEITQNGEQKKVKLGARMMKTLRGFRDKVEDGLTTVRYIPEVMLDKVKNSFSNVMIEAEDHKSKAKEEKAKKEAAQTSEKENKKKSAKSEEKTTDTNEKAQQATEGTETQSLATIQGKSLASVKVGEKSAQESQQSAQTEEVNGALEQKNAPAQAEVVELPATVEPKEEKPKKEKKNLEDLTEFATYKDYKYAYFWNYKINKYDVDVLDSVAKDLAKVADVNQFRTLLTEAQFIEGKAKQVSAKKIADLNKKHKEEMKAAEQQRQADVQAAKDERQAEVDNLNERLETAKSKNRILNSKLKVTTESLALIQEKADLVGIQAISDIIKSANEKCEGIEQRAKERAKAKEASADAAKTEIDAQVDEIMKGINDNVYGDSSTVEVSEPKQEETTVAPQITETELAGSATSDTSDNALISELDENNPIFDSNSSNSADAINSEASVDSNLETSPIFNPNETKNDYSVNFESNSPVSTVIFDDATNQAAAEYATQSNGRTR